jgi:hypothetical protein
MYLIDKDLDLNVEDNQDQRWLQLIEEWRQSGLTAAEWVRERDDISYDQFMKNKRRLFPEEVQRSEFWEKKTTWSALKVEVPSACFDVYINDCRVVVGSGFDQELLRELVEVLKSAN